MSIIRLLSMIIFKEHTYHHYFTISLKKLGFLKKNKIKHKKVVASDVDDSSSGLLIVQLYCYFEIGSNDKSLYSYNDSEQPYVI